MVEAADIVAEQEAGLALLFQRGLELALKIQEDAMAAETAEERASLALAFHRLSRSVRQTAALRTRLAADARKAEREEEAAAVEARQAKVARRAEQVGAAVERLIWREAEDEDASDDLKEDLAERLKIEACDDGFADQPIGDQIARIAEALGLSPSADPEPSGGSIAEAADGPTQAGLTESDLPDDDYWRSSA